MSRLRREMALGVKRCIDLVGAAAGLAILSPVLAATGIAIWMTDGRPVLFRQARPGLHGASFTILKFRTMRHPRADEVWYRTDERRVTRLGRFLRATSVDELPELWNVLRGEMSLVGPRPLLVEYLDKYTPEERRRHDVRPGVTGWAAVNGRHALKFKDRLRLDVWYVDHWSLALDLEILLLTIHQVLRRADVVSTQSVAEIGFPLDLEASSASKEAGEEIGESVAAGPASTAGVAGAGASSDHASARAMPLVR